VTPARIELSSGLGVEGPAPMSTSQALYGQSTASSGEETSGEGKRQGRQNRPRRPMLPVGETPADLSERSSDQALDQESEPESERQKRSTAERRWGAAPH
jgi:hypothetical protein